MTNRFSDPSFENVMAGSFGPSQCSPESDDPDFLGILLNAPEIVKFSPGESDGRTGAFAPVIVCGKYKFEYSMLGLNGKFVTSIVLVAVDEDSRISFHGTMPGVENAVRGPSAASTKPDEGDFTVTKVGGYFNPNLAAILDLPAKPANYIVYALLGSYESNRVRISIQELDE